MKSYDRVLVAITNDIYEHIVGMWDTVKECAIDLKTSVNVVSCKILRKSIDNKLNARFEWMVLENDK